MTTDNDRVSIPAEFWGPLSDQEFIRIMNRGGLNKRECRKVWKMLGRTDRPPDGMHLSFNREDIMREFPPIEKDN